MAGGVGAAVLGGVGVRATRTDTKEVTTTATTVPVMDTAVASRVAELQSWLASTGYYRGAVDGILQP